MNPDQLFLIAIVTPIIGLASAAVLGFIAYMTAKAANDAKTRDLAIDSKLRVIHSLSNSALTAAIQGRLDALMAQRVMMIERISIQTKGTDEAVNAVTSIDALIAELRTQLDERQKQTIASDMQEKRLSAALGG